jgi:Carboxypeptidase regulatory-like domain
MRLPSLSVFLLAVLVGAFPASKLNAQTTTSRGLTGVVTDPSHAVVTDASVEINDHAKGTVQSTKTDREGMYQFFFLGARQIQLDGDTSRVSGREARDKHSLGAPSFP